MQWFPIEEVPKVVECWVFGFGSGDGIRECPYIMSWDGKDWIEVYSEVKVKPTHARPLPGNPK